MANRENMFAKAAEKRKAEQNALENKLKGVEANTEEAIVNKADVPDAKNDAPKAKSDKKTPAKKATKADTNTTTTAVKARKVSMNISLPAEYKKKLNDYAAAKQLSASVVIQILIDSHCNL